MHSVPGEALAGNTMSSPFLLPLAQTLAALGFLVGCSMLTADALRRQHQQEEEAARRGRDGSGGALQPSSQALATARLHALSGLTATLLTLTTVATNTQLSWSHAPDLLGAVAGVAAIAAALAALPLAAPAAYMRHRTAIVAAVRILLFALPNIRSPHGVPTVLQRLPSPRRLGILRDTWLLLLGSRVAVMMMASFLFPVAALPQLALSAFALHRCRTVAHLCSLPMLRHPVWRRRIAWTHAAADALLLPMAEHASGGGTPGARPAAAAPDDGTAACRVFVAAVQLAAGVVLPAVVARVVHRRLTGGDSREAEETAQGRHAAVEPQAAGGRARWRQLMAAAGRAVCDAAAAVEAWAAHGCDILAGCAGSAIVTVAAWWLVLTATWLGALVLER